MPKGKDIIGWVLKGVCVGIANVIPGVSGGTMALVLGIYERLITALNNMGPQTVLVTLKGVFAPSDSAARQALIAEWRRADILFVGFLGVGALVAIKGTASLIITLLAKHHDPTYAFFCGLILISIATPMKMLRRFGPAESVVLIVSIFLTLWLVMPMASDAHIAQQREKEIKKRELAIQMGKVTPGDGETAAPATKATAADTPAPIALDHSPMRLLWFFFCGMVAISAMILPGISGSFVLLTMGAYFDIMTAVKTLDLWIIAATGLGAGVGLLVFTRLLKWLFREFHDATVAALIGLMIGSLYALWPFRYFEMVAGKRVDGRLLLPEINGNFWLSIVTFVIGGALVVGFMVLEKKLGAAERKASGAAAGTH